MIEFYDEGTQKVIGFPYTYLFWIVYRIGTRYLENMKSSRVEIWEEQGGGTLGWIFMANEIAFIDSKCERKHGFF